MQIWRSRLWDHGSIPGECGQVHAEAILLRSVSVHALQWIEVSIGQTTHVTGEIHVVDCGGGQGFFVAGKKGVLKNIS